MRGNLTRFCERCGAPFVTEPNVVRRGYGRFCTPACVWGKPAPLLALSGGAVFGVPLTRGKIALIDPEDAERVSPYRWHASPIGQTWYALAHGGRSGRLAMHRLILGLRPGDPDVDHINGDGLDNRRCNLRAADDSQNQANRCRQPNNTSGYRGVSLYARSGKWVAMIKIGGRNRNLGHFATREEAARAYDAKAREVFGEFARPNFPEAE